MSSLFSPNRIRRICLSAVFLTLFLLSSCGKTESEEDLSAEILTNIFSKHEFAVPDDYWMTWNVTPYYDEETETVTTFSISRKEQESESGEIITQTNYWLYTFTLDGETLAAEQITLPSHINYVHYGQVTEDSLIYVDATTEETTVYRLDRETGETISTERSAYFFNDDEFTFTYLCIDKDGLIYCASQTTVYVLNSDLSLAFSLDFPTSVYTMASGADGAVWVTLNAGMESCAAKIDTENRKLGEYYTFTRGSDSLSSVRHYLLNAAGESETYNFYYYDKKEAVWGVTVGEEGSLTEERLIDLYNSGIAELYGLSEYTAMRAGLYANAVLSEECLLTAEYNGWQNSFPILYRRAEDVDTSAIESLTIAYAYALDPTVVKQITEFDSEHQEITVVMADYSQYATEEDPMAGEDKLCFDIVNGFIKPDLVVTDAGISTVSDDMVMTQLCRNGLYVDLVPYLEKDDTINFDTLFGCIPRIFDDGQGGMWGISTTFGFTTLIGKAELLGEYTEKGYWSLDEMFDFMDSLPEETEKYFQLTSGSPDWAFMSEGYSLFFDDDSCSFNSDTFIRCLETQRGLPANYKEWKQVSLYRDAILNSDALIPLISQEKVGLTRCFSSGGFLAPVFCKRFLNDEVFPIGFATKSDSGTKISVDSAYIITTFSEVPDLCFELIKSFFETDIYDSILNWNDWKLTVLKPLFEKAMDVCTESLYEPLTEEEYVKLYDLFDNSGSPILEKTPTAVQEIIEEELSAYLAGMGTAEDCAEKIQSRVEIWIAEHE